MTAQQHPSEQVVRIMEEFARRTGLVGTHPPHRYLWTDSFAVCTFLGLYQRTGESHFLNLALTLVEQVHRVLGRYREDDPRSGWISGLDEQEGARHPTAGGLRIGKKLPERRPGEPLDEQLEWDRDGQYYHYLTKWMHALNLTGQVTGRPLFLHWALELAQVAQARFVVQTTGGTRMVWKMATDLSRPLVAAMGQHDPLDGYVTLAELQAACRRWPREEWPDLTREWQVLAGICQEQRWYTDDFLGIGGLFVDVLRIGLLLQSGFAISRSLLPSLLHDGLQGLERGLKTGALNAPLSYRLAFRELGLALGLHALERLPAVLDRTAGDGLAGESRDLVRRGQRYVSVAAMIEAFWLDPVNQQSAGWREHRDINEVMLATSLLPEGFLQV